MSNRTYPPASVHFSGRTATTTYESKEIRIDGKRQWVVRAKANPRRGKFKSMLNSVARTIKLINRGA